MSHIGILCPAAIGHLNPMANLGHELQKRGHKVTLFGVSDVAEKMPNSQLDFFEIGEDYLPGTIDLIYTRMGELTGLEGSKYAMECFQEEMLMLFREAPDAITQAGVNALLIDQTVICGGTIADYLNLPFINICNALPFNR